LHRRRRLVVTRAARDATQPRLPRSHPQRHNPSCPDSSARQGRAGPQRSGFLVAGRKARSSHRRTARGGIGLNLERPVVRPVSDVGTQGRPKRPMQ
jgi:hypothetical protein